MKCADCGTSEGRIINSKKYGRALCNKCYQTNRDAVFHELPPKGEVRYDKSGNPICHICGRATKKLMSHVWQKHDLSAHEYKREFGLNTTKGIMSECATALARQRNLEHRDIVVYKNLVEKGKPTRFLKGSPGRTRASLSLQELNSLKARFRRRRAVL